MKKELQTGLFVALFAIGVGILLHNLIKLAMYFKERNADAVARIAHAQDDAGKIMDAVIIPNNSIDLGTNRSIFDIDGGVHEPIRFETGITNSEFNSGIYIEGGGDFTKATNPNDFTVRWSLPDGTWKATWTKE